MVAAFDESVFANQNTTRINPVFDADAIMAVFEDEAAASFKDNVSDIGSDELNNRDSLVEYDLSAFHALVPREEEDIMMHKDMPEPAAAVTGGYIDVNASEEPADETMADVIQRIPHVRRSSEDQSASTSRFENSFAAVSRPDVILEDVLEEAGFQTPDNTDSQRVPQDDSKDIDATAADAEINTPQDEPSVVMESEMAQPEVLEAANDDTRTVEPAIGEDTLAAPNTSESEAVEEPVLVAISDSAPVVKEIKQDDDEDSDYVQIGEPETITPPRKHSTERRESAPRLNAELLAKIAPIFAQKTPEQPKQPTVAPGRLQARTTIASIADNQAPVEPDQSAEDEVLVARLSQIADTDAPTAAFEVPAPPPMPDMAALLGTHTSATVTPAEPAFPADISVPLVPEELTAGLRGIRDSINEQLKQKLMERQHVQPVVSVKAPVANDDDEDFFSPEAQQRQMEQEKQDQTRAEQEREAEIEPVSPLPEVSLRKRPGLPEHKQVEQLRKRMSKDIALEMDDDFSALAQQRLRAQELEEQQRLQEEQRQRELQEQRDREERLRKKAQEALLFGAISTPKPRQPSIFDTAPTAPSTPARQPSISLSKAAAAQAAAEQKRATEAEKVKRQSTLNVRNFIRFIEALKEASGDDRISHARDLKNKVIKNNTLVQECIEFGAIAVVVDYCREDSTNKSLRVEALRALAAVAVVQDGAVAIAQSGVIAKIASLCAIPDIVAEAVVVLRVVGSHSSEVCCCI